MSNVLPITKAKQHGDGVFQRRISLQKSEKINYKKKQIKRVNVSGEARWIHIIMRTLIGTNIMPVVHAAEVPKPQKPPPMGYKDLPIYKTPHYDYKVYTDDTQKCADANKKILQSMVFPIVQNTRNRLKTMFYGMTDELKLMKNEVSEVICQNKKDFIKYMRSPDNDSLRKVVVASGTITGLYLASGTRNIVKKTFGAFAGAVCTGGLCFPKQTDEAIRTVCFYTGKCVFNVFSRMCNKYEMDERLPCPEELPPLPAPLTKEQANVRCIVKDEKKK